MARKNPMPVLSIPADKETHQRLQAAADADMRSKSNMGLLLLKKALDSLPNENTPPENSHSLPSE